MAFYALGELGDFPDPVENGDTFTENAVIKAQAACEETGLPAVADDSGLVVDALSGEPGIMSARWAGVHGDDARNNAKLMREMEDVADAGRTARFHSSVVLVYPDGMVLTGEGDCEGMIGREPRGENGFGYDPLFWPTETPGRHDGRARAVREERHLAPCPCPRRPCEAALVARCLPPAVPKASDPLGRVHMPSLGR